MSTTWPPNTEDISSSTARKGPAGEERGREMFLSCRTNGPVYWRQASLRAAREEQFHILFLVRHNVTEVVTMAVTSRHKRNAPPQEGPSQKRGAL
jgi:hypothetical protein